MTHKQRMIDHFLYLRERDQDYARSAVQVYVKMPFCPCPEIAKDVREAWLKLSDSSRDTKSAAI